MSELDRVGKARLFMSGEQGEGDHPPKPSLRRIEPKKHWGGGGCCGGGYCQAGVLRTAAGCSPLLWAVAMEMGRAVLPGAVAMGWL